MPDPFEGTYRPMLEDETDKDSPDNETTYAQVRVSIETLLKNNFYTGDSGTLSEDPPDDASGVLTDSGASYDADEHNGRLTIIIDGLGEGQVYTIDDTAATTLTHTGDNLYSDGVRSGDKYMVFYNFLSPGSAHDHDDFNSKAVVLAANQVQGSNIDDDSIDSRHYIANSIDTEHYAPGSVDQDAVGASAVGQGELKTAETTLTYATGAGGNQVWSGGKFMFYPRIKRQGIISSAATARFAAGQVPAIGAYNHYYNLTQDAAETITAQVTYVQASGEVYWIFILRNKQSKKHIFLSFAPDHVCFGNGGKPELTPHPFPDVYEEDDKLYHPIRNFQGEIIDREEVEILVINPPKEQVVDMEELSIIDNELEPDKLEPDKCISDVFREYYDLDDSFEPPWPSEPVTVGFPLRDENGDLISYYRLPDGTKVSPIKKVIPKPAMVRTAAIIKR